MKAQIKLSRAVLAVVSLGIAVLGGACEIVIGPNDRMVDPSYGTAGTGGMGGANAQGGGGGSTACKPGDEKPCYTGPAGTEGTGTCKAGTQTCKPDGSGFGECTGQVMPQAETCGGTMDANCDGFLCGETEWATAFGSTNASSVATGVDGAGNVYVAGFFYGPMKIGTTTLVGFGGKDIFVAKFDPKGSLLWADQFGDTGDDVAQALAVDASGNVVITGAITGPVDFGSGPVDGLIYVLKLDAAGKHVWSVSCGGSQPAMTSVVGGTGIALDTNGYAIVAGTFGDTANCGDAMHASAGGLDILVAKLSGTDGHALWSSAFGDSADQRVSGVAADSAGNVFITGPENGSVNFGGMPLVGAGFYVARFSPSGAHGWSRQWGSANAAAPAAIAIDSAGAPILTGGYRSSSLDFGAGALPAPPSNGSGVFVLKLDAGGNHVWSRGFAPASGSGAGGRGLAVDVSDQIVVTGYFGPNIEIDGMSLTTTLWNAAFVARLDSKQGDGIWSRLLGNGGSNDHIDPAAIAVGPSGEIAMGGMFEGIVDVGDAVLTPSNPGSQSYFLLKLAP